MTFEQGLFDGQLRSKFRAIVACPHCVPFIAGGNGKCFPSNLFKMQKNICHLLLVFVCILSRKESIECYLISSKQLF